MGIKLALNLAIRDNFGFVDPAAPIALDLFKPSGEAPRLTASILRGVRGKTLIDVNKVIDLETGKLKDPAADEAKRKAEEEAKQKALNEAKEKADKEAKQKAEDDAKKAEEEAKRLADEEAQRKAEEDAQRLIDDATNAQAPESDADKLAGQTPVDGDGSTEGTIVPDDHTEVVPTVEPKVVDDKKDHKPKGSNKKDQTKAE